MAFNKANWKNNGNWANAPSIHTYTTTDTATTLAASGYFNSINEELNVGDLIYAVTSSGGTVAPGFFYVRSNTGGVVDCDDITAITVTNAG